jgi:signal transduction histidine kinase
MPASSHSSIASPTVSGDERLLRLRWPLIVGVWMVPALLAAFETYMFWRMSGRNHPFWRALVMEGPSWLVYAVLTPLIFALGRRLPLQRERLVRNAVVHLLVALCAGVVYCLVATKASKSFSPVPIPMPFGRMALSWTLSALPLTTLAYFGILGVGAALTHLADARRREMDAARLSAQLAEARLGALRMQLHPHFLFNTLNAVTVLARDRDTVGTVRMLTLLSDLLRDVLRTDRGHDVSVDEELAFARRYLEIELVRFADRLNVRERVDDDVRDLRVPVFVLQPLIENALRHGIASKAQGGTVTLGGRSVGDDLELWVEDDGVGLSADWTADDYGIGLANTAARLSESFGARGTVVLSRVTGGGTRATVHLPRSGQRVQRAGGEPAARRQLVSTR